ncbi:MAG: COX15/CtaA family protein [Betaproteobacteria bacterium]
MTHAEPDPREARTLRRLSVAGLLLALTVTTASAYLRLGLDGRVCGGSAACSDVAPLPAEAAVRLTHRIAASSEIPVVAALAVFGWRRRRGRPAQARAAGVALSALLLLAIVGTLAGGSRLPIITLANFTGGFVLLAALAASYALGVRGDRSRVPDADLRRASRRALAVTVAQIAVGALASAGFAGVACHGGPVCADAWNAASVLDQFNPLTIRLGSDGRAIPASAAIALMWLHRMLGFVAGGYLLWFASRLRGEGLTVEGGAVAALVCMQILLAATVATPALPVTTAVLHNLLAALLLLTQAAVAVRLATARTRAGVPGPGSRSRDHR